MFTPTGSEEAGAPFFRCVLDGALRVPETARLFREPAAGSPVVVFTTPGADPERRRAIERAGGEVVCMGSPEGPIPPRDVLRELGRRGVLGVVVEGGGTTHGLFLSARMADKLAWYVAPRVLGDPQAVPAVRRGPARLEEALSLEIAGVERLEDDLLITLYPA